MSSQGAQAETQIANENGAPAVISDKKDLYEVGEIPPLGHVPKNMYAWAIRPDREGPPDTAMQVEVVPTWELDSHEVLVLVMAAGVNYNGIWASLVECRLETGRTHQVRVHMTHIGHSLVGDPVYGRATRSRTKGLPDDVTEAKRGFSRQALHARLLAFDHPVTGKRMSFETELPSDMKKLCDILETV